MVMAPSWFEHLRSTPFRYHLWSKNFELLMYKIFIFIFGQVYTKNFKINGFIHKHMFYHVLLTQIKSVQHIFTLVYRLYNILGTFCKTEELPSVVSVTSNNLFI